MPKPNSETWISMDRININSWNDPTKYPDPNDNQEFVRPVLQCWVLFQPGEATNAQLQHFTNDCPAAEIFRTKLDAFRAKTPTLNGLIGTFTIVQHLSEVVTLLGDTAQPQFRQYPASNVWENLQEYFDIADPPRNIIQGILDSASGKVKFQSVGHGLVDDDAITITGSSVAAYNRRHKVRKLNNNEFRSNVDFAGNSGACTFKKALYVKAAGPEAVAIATGDFLADYWIDLRNATIREIHATKIANRALERSGAAPWFGTKLLCMDVMTHPMFIGPPSAPYADWPSQVDFVMRLKNKIRSAGLYVDSLIGWNLMNSTAVADIDAMSEYMDGVYLEGFLQKANVDNSTGTTQIRRLRRFHSNGRGCLTYLQPRRGIKGMDPINVDDFQRVLIPTSVTPVTGGVEVVCDRPHHLDLTHQKTAYLFDVNGTKSGNSINISKIIRGVEIVTDKKVKLLIPVSAEQPDTISPLVGTSRIYFNGADNEVQAMVAMWVTGDEAGNAGIWRPYQQVTSSPGTCRMTIPAALPAGQELKVTSTIIFVSGPHAGIHTITQVLSSTQFVTDRPFISAEGYGYWYLVQGCFIKWDPGSSVQSVPNFNLKGAPWDPINGNIATGWRAKVGFANGAIPLAPPKESFQSVANNGANKCRITANGHRLLAGLEINVIGGSYAGVHVITAVVSDNQFDTDRNFTATATGTCEAKNTAGPTEWRLNFKKGSAEHVGHLLPQYRVAYWRVKSTGAIVTSF